MRHIDDICAKCGGSSGIHRFDTQQCPMHGVEAPVESPQLWQASTFTPIPFNPPEELARNITKREYFAAMAMQGSIAGDAENIDTFATTVEYAVRMADALIEELNKETK